MNARTLALFALAMLSTGAAAQAADTVVARFTPAMGVSLNYFQFGYTDANDDYHVLTDQNIVSTRIVIDFTPGPDVDPATFFAAMVVPVVADNQYLTVEGAKLTAMPGGVYHYEATTDEFNGTIYAGRFSVDCYGVDPISGDPASLAGSSFGPDTGFFFTVAVPEPTTLSALGGSLLMTRRRRIAR